jgi:hypothetical protein
VDAADDEHTPGRTGGACLEGDDRAMLDRVAEQVLLPSGCRLTGRSEGGGGEGGRGAGGQEAANGRA